MSTRVRGPVRCTAAWAATSTRPRGPQSATTQSRPQRGAATDPRTQHHPHRAQGSHHTPLTSAFSPLTRDLNTAPGTTSARMALIRSLDIRRSGPQDLCQFAAAQQRVDAHRSSAHPVTCAHMRLHGLPSATPSDASSTRSPPCTRAASPQPQPASACGPTKVHRISAPKDIRNELRPHIAATVRLRAEQPEGGSSTRGAAVVGSAKVGDRHVAEFVCAPTLGCRAGGGIGTYRVVEAGAEGGAGATVFSSLSGSERRICLA